MYTLTFVEKSNYLQIIFSGNFEAGDVHSSWSEINAYLKEHTYQHILVEEDLGTTGELRTLEVFEAAKFLA